MRYKVYNVGSGWDGGWILNHEIVSNPIDADVITFPGGSDIHPSLYGEKVGSRTYAHQALDEIQLEYAINPAYKDKIKVGLCRGAQLLTAISGGKLVQHFTSHNGSHRIMINNDPENQVLVNSLHHQMMYPFNLDPNTFDLIGRACDHKGLAISTSFYNGEDAIIDMPKDKYGYIEPEIVFYKNTKSLCFQFHPEMMSWERNPATLTLCNELLNHYYAKNSK